MENTILSFNWCNLPEGCGLIKVWKTRYFSGNPKEAPASCGLIKVWKTRYYSICSIVKFRVVVWLKFGKHDISCTIMMEQKLVVVWLKFGKHDITIIINSCNSLVVVWLKFGKHDILFLISNNATQLWFD